MQDRHHRHQPAQGHGGGIARDRNLLRTLIDNLPDCIYVKDRQGRFLAANLATALIMGVAAPDDLLGKSDADFYPPDLATQYRADEEELCARDNRWSTRKNRTWLPTAICGQSSRRKSQLRMGKETSWAWWGSAVISPIVSGRRRRWQHYGQSRGADRIAWVPLTKPASREALIAAVASVAAAEGATATG